MQGTLYWYHQIPRFQQYKLELNVLLSKETIIGLAKGISSDMGETTGETKHVRS